ncbi:uncharacterized protein BKA78DRAFT_98891 [Phyllosticta capitalensis]|uniref:uncharacterized protein n=1 Tax=Phyllosticta capitalensis TaxID=121624 RepID=UPI00312FCDC6
MQRGRDRNRNMDVTLFKTRYPRHAGSQRQRLDAAANTDYCQNDLSLSVAFRTQLCILPLCLPTNTNARPPSVWTIGTSWMSSCYHVRPSFRTARPSRPSVSPSDLAPDEIHMFTYACSYTYLWMIASLASIPKLQPCVVRSTYGQAKTAAGLGRWFEKCPPAAIRESRKGGGRLMERISQPHR